MSRTTRTTFEVVKVDPKTKRVLVKCTDYMWFTAKEWKGET